MAKKDIGPTPQPGEKDTRVSFFHSATDLV
jgi:hypothetical protein